MKVSIWDNHGCNIFGASDTLHFTELIEILQDPCPQRIRFLDSIMHPATFTTIQMRPAMKSTERNTWCQCTLEPSKKEWGNSKIISLSAFCKLQEFQAVWVPWDNYLLEPSEVRVKSHKKDTTSKKTLSYSSSHTKMSSFCSSEFHVCDAVSEGTSRRATEKCSQYSVLKHREHPRMTATWTNSIKVSQKITWFLRSTRDMDHGSGIYLKDVVRHLTGGDPSLWGEWVSWCTSKASTYGRRKEFTVTIVQ